MRYCLQRHQATCGPTAIVNAMKWLNKPASYKRLVPQMMKQPGFHCQRGITSGYFDRMIRKYIKNVKIKHQPSFLETIDHLGSGGSIIILFSKDPNDAHYAFLTKNHNEYEGVNLYSFPPTRRPVSAFILSYLVVPTDKYYPKMWFIYPEKA